MKPLSSYCFRRRCAFFSYLHPEIPARFWPGHPEFSNDKSTANGAVTERYVLQDASAADRNIKPGDKDTFVLIKKQMYGWEAVRFVSRGRQINVSSLGKGRRNRPSLLCLKLKPQAQKAAAHRGGLKPGRNINKKTKNLSKSAGPPLPTMPTQAKSSSLAGWRCHCSSKAASDRLASRPAAR